MDDSATFVAVAAVLIAAASELIGMSKLKDNSVIQLALRLLARAFPRPNK